MRSPRLRRGRQRRRGVGFMFFMLVALPTLFFAGVLAVDLSQVLKTHRTVTNTADASALAGAFEFEEGQTSLDQYRAGEMSQRAWDRSVELGTVRGASDVRTSVETTAETVTVEVTYDIDGLVFLGYFNLAGLDDVTVQSTAAVCVPGSSAYTEGFCTRPQLR